MQASFGQWKAKKARSCLNTGIIRTVEGEKSKKLSECRHHSDSPRRKKHGAVRMQVSFGQTKTKKARSCLNEGIIQTGQGENSKRLSECEYHSDRPRRKK